MIANDTQYNITKTWINKWRNELKKEKPDYASQEMWDIVMEAMKSQLDSLEIDVAEYEDRCKDGCDAAI